MSTGFQACLHDEMEIKAAFCFQHPLTLTMNILQRSCAHVDAYVYAS